MGIKFFLKYLSPDENSGGGSGGANGGSGGTDDKSKEKESGGSGGSDEGKGKGTVSYDTYQKVLDERKRDQKRLEELERKEKDREEAEAKKAGDYEKVLKNREEELEKANKKAAALEKEREDALKLHAFQKHLPGKLDSQYFGLVDLDDVVVDPTTGKVDEASAQKAAKAFADKYSKVVDKGSKGKMPNEAANGGGSAGGFIEEIRAAKTQKEYDAVMKKYEKL